MYKRIIFLFIFLLTCWLDTNAQICSPNTPTFTVDLTGNPDSVWISPNVVRKDYCCGASNPDRCVQFIVTLDPGASSISFNVYSGAMPPGALFYQLNCGPETPVGTPLCLDGPGPHVITFCKPGNNENQYSITSIPAPGAPNSLVINDGCTGTITTTGFQPSTIVWNSIYPGTPGAYNSYLNCSTGCSTVNVVAQAGYPPYIDYQVCGMPVGNCGGTVCRTSRIYFNPTLFANIEPINPTVCFGQATTTITANGTGGTPPYNYTWNTGATTQSINVGPGTYSVVLGDASGCPPTTASVTVTGFASVIAANAGSDQIICRASPTVTLNGSITAASGGIWSGGSGTFIPDNSTLNATYTPSQSEINNGSATLILTSTGNGTCPAASDTMTISIVNFTGVAIIEYTPVSCFGGSNGTATVNVSGGTSPFTYSWNTNPIQTGITATNLTAGTYTVTITDGNGCINTASTNITQPALLTATTTAGNVSCRDGSDGFATVTAFGGTAGYSYSWSSGATGPTANNLSAGTYTVTITDAKGCQTTRTVVITQPSLLTANAVNSAVSCFGGNNGTATVTANGGTPGYTYSWTPGGSTASNVTGLTSGTYTATVTDSKGCNTTATTTITEPTAAVTVNITSNNVTCFGGSNGTATAAVTGGTSGYTYSWSTGSTSSTINNLTEGTYTITVTDNRGCVSNQQVIITQPNQIAISFNSVNTVCGLPNGSISAQVTGGTGAYTYSWSNGGTGTSINEIFAGNYSVTVTDANGCSRTTATSIINNNPSINSNISSFNNVLCFGGNTGSATVAVIGGVPSFTYSWSGGAGSSATATNLPAGTYTVTITDANTCQTSSTITITQPATAVSAAITSSSNLTCNGSANGTATVEGSGGTPGYSYSWSGRGVTTQTITGLPAGTYTAIVTDANGCRATTIVTITQPPVLTTTVSTTQLTCNNSGNGAASANVTGGTAPYTYSWSAGGSGSSTSGLTAGNYSLTVTDANGCQVNRNFTITQPGVLNAVITLTNVSCNGTNTGSAIATPSGGTAPYTYSWSNGSTTNTATNLFAGSYTLLLTDSRGCQRTFTLTITQPTALNITLTSIPVKCKFGSDGTATVNVSGGVAPYTYSWSNSGTAATATGLTAGSYNVTVTDSRGCIINGNVVVTEPVQILAGTLLITNVSCNGGNNGSITANASGGTVPYTYSWSPVNSSSSTISNLTFGDYSVTITDAKGCNTVIEGEVIQPLLLDAQINNTVDVKCFGDASGTASVAVSGGSPAYTYSWTSGSTNASANNLPAGNYTVTITDSKNCITTADIIINQPLAALSIDLNPTNNLCYGDSTGAIASDVTGGTPPFSYTWTSYGGNNANASNLVAGTYTLIIRDFNTCILSETTTITQPTKIEAETDSVNSTCGDVNGQASVNVTGGTSPYTYLWTSGGTASVENNLPSGNHSVTITDATGCIKVAEVIVNNINGPSAVIFSTENVSCYGGSDGEATVSESGGTGPYTYSWNTTPMQTTPTAVNLSAGIYTVTVTDANGCQGLATTNPEITQPDPLNIITSSTDVSCNGGSDGTIAATVFGGTAPYNYSWSAAAGNISSVNNLSAGTHTLTVTDNNGCILAVTVVINQPLLLTSTINTSPVSCTGGFNGSVSVNASGGTPGYNYLWTPGGYTSSSVSGLIAGTYNVTITDQNGCSTTNSVDVTEPTEQLTATFSKTDVSCSEGNDGSATINVSGGTLSYTYLWPGAISTTNTATGLAAGNYIVGIRDANGCRNSVSISISQPTAIEINIAGITDVKCFGDSSGSASVGVSGGTPTYIYNWALYGTSATADSLPVGTYTVSVTDSKGCVKDTTVIISQPTAALESTFSVSNNLCLGDSSGTATVIPTGGTSPYTFSWSSGSGDTITAGNLIAGTYTVLITDTNGCLHSNTVTLTQPTTEVDVNIVSFTDAFCNGSTDGSITVEGAGGTPGYNYSWAHSGVTDSIATGLGAGTYTVTVTDANGCEASKSQDIGHPDLLSAIVTITNGSCTNGNNGTATVTASGGNGGYSYSWSNNQQSQTAFNLTAGTYTVLITDNKGCTFVDSAVINQPFPLTSSINSQPVSCFGGSDGIATVIAQGGTPSYTYSWSTSSANATINNLANGIYYVTITDALGCIKTDSVSISQPTPVTLTLSSTPANCKNGSDGTATVTAGGGTPNYEYSWSPGFSTTPTITGLIAGTYVVTVTDDNGCAINGNVNVSEPATFVSATNTQTNVSCYGGNDGTATVIASDGTPGYNYSWSHNNDTSATSDSLVAGLYTITIIDNNSCPTTINIEIIQPQPLVISSTINDSYCGLNTGTATISVSGGTGPYNFSWNPGSNSSSIGNNLSQGTYEVTSTDSKGCVITTGFDISNVSGGAASISASTNITCFGLNNGTASAEPVGGISPFTYSWAPSGDTAADVTELHPGNHTVTITDSMGCATSANVNITQPSKLSAGVSSFTNPRCNGAANGTATAIASGGVPSHTFLWMTNPTQGTATANGLIAGSYTVIISDQNNCKDSATVTLTQPMTLTSAFANVKNVTCNNFNNGQATANGSGGTFPYTYSWNTSPAQTTSTANNLSPGSYTIQITDAKGCTSTSNISITQPSSVITTASANVTICDGSSTNISASATGGNGGYFYDWNQGLSVQDNHTVSPTSSTTYIVTAYDSLGCPGNPDSLRVTVIKLIPGSLYVFGNNRICPGTSSIVYATVRDTLQGPFTYSWNHGLGPGPGAFDISPTEPTTYIVTVTNSCGATVTDSVKVEFKSNPQLQFTTSATSGCAPLRVNFTDLSTTPTDSISSWNWTFGDGTSSTAPNPQHLYNAMGSYPITLTITTTGGCTQTLDNSGNVIQVYPSPNANFTVAPKIVSIPKELINTANNSSGGITYEWDFGDGTTSTEFSPSHEYTNVGNFTVRLITTNQYNCKDTTYDDVTATSDIQFPTAFTPNLGGSNGGAYDANSYENDVFFPYTAGVKDYHLMIFNRWGELIFESFDSKIGWDGYYRGKLCTQDVYVWKVSAMFYDGRPFNKVGDVTLLR